MDCDRQASGPSTGGRKRLLWTVPAVAGLIAATVVAHGPGLNNAFVNWDDDVYVLNNPHLTAPDGLRRIWLTMESPQYYPLVFTTIWVEHRLWGKWPAGYHTVNLALHIVNVLLVMALFRRLGARGTAAWIGAAFFALHPVQVASVAWVVELKNVLSTLFYLGAMLLYMRWRAGQGAVWYATALLLFAAALLSKTATLTLPVSLLLLDWLVSGRSLRRSALSLVPFVFLTAAAAAVTVLAEDAGAAHLPGFGLRVLIACAAFWFYLGKVIWPISQPGIYPLWAVSWSWWPGWLALGACGATTFAVAIVRKKISGPTQWGLAHVAVSLAPVLGLVPFGYMEKSYVADHFLYLPLIGSFFVLGVWLDRTGREVFRFSGGRAIFAVVTGVWLATLGTKTWHQTQVWASSDRLWTHTIRLNPECAAAHNNLGIVRMQQGNLSAAIEHYRRALQADPDDSMSHNNYGAALARQGKHDDAIRHYRRAIKRNPNYVDAYRNLGLVLIDTKQLDEAERAFEKVLALKPSSATAYHGLGRVMAFRRNWPEAVAHYHKALDTKPLYPDALANLGGALSQLGKHKQAQAHLRRALEIKPDHAGAHSSLAGSLEAQKRFPEAEHHYRRAVEIAPANPTAYYNLGNILAKQNRLAQATELYRKALSLRPNYMQAHINLGNALQGLGRFDAAIAQYRKALSLAPAYPTLAYNLVTALSAVGDYAAAMDTLNKALKRKAGRGELVNALAWLLATCPMSEYRNGPQALRIARQLSTATKGNNAQVLDTLAAALAETGAFAQAVETAKRAASLAKQQGMGELARDMTARLRLYQDRKPFRQRPRIPRARPTTDATKH